MMATGSRHDSVPGMFAMHRCTQAMGYGVENGCFDSAHDAIGFYRTSHDIWGTKPFIPLNNRNEGNIKNLPMSGMTDDGIPETWFLRSRISSIYPDNFTVQHANKFITPFLHFFPFMQSIDKDFGRDR